MSVEKQKGTAWESRIAAWLSLAGLYTERRTLAGAKDRGDLNVSPDVVIEAKNCNRIELAAWLDEAKAEGHNAGAWLYAVWAHRKGRAGAVDGYVVLDGLTFTRILVLLREDGRIR